ncbi:MAG: hypothetical protein JWL77_2800 [Chthonomonadaceae bacterium]|nr:hypothetical protein [Chthonomonadaceae bacterium]
MSVVVYLDETGDHSMEVIDRDFPVFGLIMVIADLEEYVEKIVPAVHRLKLDYFGHEGVILHSYDIRKQKGDFRFLNDQTKREGFYERINGIMGGMDYSLIATLIRKQAHKDRYGAVATNPYDLALELALERLLPLLEQLGQTEVNVIAEARGKKEDDDLNVSFDRFAIHGNDYITTERVRGVKFTLTFVQKARNIVGMQIADLAAYPIARHVIDPSKPNPAYEIIKSKFYIGPGMVRGLKIFP